MQRCAAGGSPVLGFEMGVEGEGVARREWLCNTVPLRDSSGLVTGCVATFQDVTELKQALRDSARYAAIVASSQDAIVGVALDGMVTDWNGGAEALFGYTASEMVGHPLHILVPDGLGQETEDRLAELRAGAQPSAFETKRLRKDGAEVEVSVMISPIRDSGGRVVGFSKLVRDITERRREERHRIELERKIHETQKLESLGVLAGGIAHDFNNLLTGVLGNASLASMSLPASSAARPFLQAIEQAACRAAELCAQMLAYARRGRFVARPIELNRLIEETTHLISVSISKNAVLRLNLAPGLLIVPGDPTQIRQILMNLVINASEAIGERSGVIAITTGLVRVDASYLATVRHAEDMAEGDHAFVEVSDTGCGMDAATLARIFDPFFTTKFTGRGLGLAAVLGIVRSHKGGLKVYSEPRRGTTFKLLLPVGADAANLGEIEAEAAGKPSLAGAGEPAFRPSGSVLVVDDEETVRAVAARMLEALGFTVELASDGREAIAKFALNPSAFSLVLLDLTMPHLDGEETFRQLRHIRPGVRVVLMSGFNEQEATGGFTGKGLAGYIAKPFAHERFVSVIREAYEGRSA